MSGGIKKSEIDELFKKLGTSSLDKLSHLNFGNDVEEGLSSLTIIILF
ncbi:MAG: hypothetical protein LBC39_08620 [Methanobrevibacter sp.]|jgi:hypothetical protein|nr:hypothetical protein [Candidatus Methanovirga aequatorialis]